MTTKAKKTVKKQPVKKAVTKKAGKVKPQKPKAEPPIPVEKRPSFVSTKAEYINYLTCFASREETRYYLQGICVERHPEKGILLIATDGHRLGVIHDENGVLEGPNNIIVHVDDKFIKASDRAVKSKKTIPCGFYYYNAASMFILGCHCHTAESLKDLNAVASITQEVIVDKLIDGTFPAWRQVMPLDFAASPAIAFNPKYAMDFAYPNNVKGVTFYPSKDGGPIMVKISWFSEFVGVLMPLRETGTAKYPAFMDKVLDARREELAKKKREIEAEAEKAKAKADKEAEDVKKATDLQKKVAARKAAKGKKSVVKKPAKKLKPTKKSKR